MQNAKIHLDENIPENSIEYKNYFDNEENVKRTIEEAEEKDIEYIKKIKEKSKNDKNIFKARCIVLFSVPDEVKIKGGFIMNELDEIKFVAKTLFMIFLGICFIAMLECLIV